LAERGQTGCLAGGARAQHGRVARLLPAGRVAREARQWGLAGHACMRKAHWQAPCRPP